MTSIQQIGPAVKNGSVNEIMDFRRNNTHTISLFVANKPGVLVRIAILFSRRGYNVESLVASPAMQGQFSRITITAQGDPETLDQIVRQLNKLVDVLHATEHMQADVIERELAMVKFRADAEERTEILQITDHFGAKTMDMTEGAMMVQIVGGTGKVDSFLSMIAKFGIIEVVRTGKIWIARGEEET